ncbi:2995_t:CDS:2 [Acaulospora morrowiae]|uniref:2995_t:CDS:1 n=1 Tax=Acaulospora morrowiae TaxID=94023 RepID=A0A9N8ZPE3_9GLOM|nr:2995_t:CDS:2 [Acaulospora morrowiae]
MLRKDFDKKRQKKILKGLASDFEKFASDDRLKHEELVIGQKPHYEEELPSTSPKKIKISGNEELVEEGISQEDLSNSVIKTFDIFGQLEFPTYYEKLKTIWNTENDNTNYCVINMGDKNTLNQVHELLSENELRFLSERLMLKNEVECISVEARSYMELFDHIVEEEGCDNSFDDQTEDTEGDNNFRNSEEFKKVIAKMEEKMRRLGSLSEKFNYLSNVYPIPPESYDQSKMPDINIIKSISSHLDTIYFSCERDVPSSVYKADGVLEFFERPNQIPLFFLEVSEGPNNPDPGIVYEDREKLMDEGVFALNKFMISTGLPTRRVCETLSVFLAQGIADKIEIGQLIFIGPGLYLFSPFTIPALTIPTSFTNLAHAPRLIRTLLCLRYNIIKKIELYKEFSKEGQQLITQAKTRYATGFSPNRSKSYHI